MQESPSAVQLKPAIGRVNMHVNHVPTNVPVDPGSVNPTRKEGDRSQEGGFRADGNLSKENIAEDDEIPRTLSNVSRKICSAAGNMVEIFYFVSWKLDRIDQSAHDFR